MSKFNNFKTLLRQNMDKLALQGDLFVVDIPKDDLWDKYLSSFPEGTNPIFRERTEHDCNCCKNFIRMVGGVVAIKNNKLVSIWEVETDDFYQDVADAMAKYVKSAKVRDEFLTTEKRAGMDYNFDNYDPELKWDHFHWPIPYGFVYRDVAPRLNRSRTDKQVLQRSLETITPESVDLVIELIQQGSLYRGEEHMPTLQKFQELYGKFGKVRGAKQKDNWLWKTAKKIGGLGRIRNTVIGSLLVDLSEGRELEAAVSSFEQKVAPANYKRPKALVTQKMIKSAQKAVEELGIKDSLPRRHAVAGDLTINNVLFANRDARSAMGDVFDEMIADSAPTAAQLKKVEEVSVEKFMSDILPQATSVEMLMEGRLKSNLMNVVAPVHEDAPNILKWGNNFSWTYTGEVTDSIKERVKAAGGDVGGFLRVSLAWSNLDDLDLHVTDPKGHTFFYGNRGHRDTTTGKLDVDMNVSNPKEGAVENVTWTDPNKMLEGTYTVKVHNFTKRQSHNQGYEIQVECDGEVQTFSSPDNDSVSKLITFKWTRAGGVEIINSKVDGDGFSGRKEDVWGIQTASFVPVSMVMNSPNHWDGEETGNKHRFFILEGCKSEGSSRGLFNEYLKPELNDHRKVFEVLGSKMRVEPSDEQLAGVGFSSTKRNHAYFKINGSFSRTVCVNF